MQSNLNNPILHDIIKSIITYRQEKVITLCKDIPAVRYSKLLSEDKRVFNKKKTQSELTNRCGFRCDVVYCYDSKKNANDEYYIVHEVKSGQYDIHDVYHKYHSGMQLQIWIWAWESEHKHNTNFCPAKIKQLNIECLLDLIKSEIIGILRDLS